MRPIIYPYKFGSRSARALSEALRARGHRAKRVRSNGNYRPYRNHLIINWGNSEMEQWDNNTVPTWMNNPLVVTNASNKLHALRAMHEAGVQVPEFTTSIADVRATELDHVLWVCRTKLQGHSGDGIVMHTTDPEEPIPEAPLYVKYVKKADEYRVHVFGGQVIDIQQKRRRRETPDDEVDYKVRNHANGWNFCRADVDTDPSISEQAIRATNALGLDFGAVDIIWNEHYKAAYVLEVNTAPGLEGTTVTKYVEAIERIL